MADDNVSVAADKKPRARMTADELLEEANGAYSRILAMLEVGGLNKESLLHLKQTVDSTAWIDALNLAQDLGFGMPYLDHAALINALLEAWECVVQMRLNTRRNCYRKVRVLEADQKTDPEVLERWLADRARADRESAAVNIGYIRMKQIYKAGEGETHPVLKREFDANALRELVK